MSDIGAWLESLGLSRYVRPFEDNDIDFSVLGDLTDQGLRELGVASLGHRLKLLRAIADRHDNAGTALQAPVTVVGAAAAAAASPAEAAVPVAARAASGGAERRQLTVMFCDLVGSTSLAARLDPEDMRDLVRTYQAACAGVIATYEGFVAQYLGDGIMAYFGYPRAHEDDAERAVRAGLDLIAAVARLDTKTKVEVRIGIATGLVVVGDLVGEHAAKERAVTGETPNLAARLQGLAAAGAIVVSASTRRLFGGVFDVLDLGPQQVKGLDAPVNAFAIKGVRSFESRFDARAGGLTGFVGRDEEAKHLTARKKLAWHGRGQVVVVSGEAGIGKSRLTAWLADETSREQHTRLRYQCTPHHRDSALYPTIVQIERAANLAATDTPEEKLTKLEAVLALAGITDEDAVPLFAALLVIPLGGRFAPLAIPPAQQRLRTMAAMLDQIEGLAKQKPVLMLYEDAHWADATSLELLDSLVDRIARLPVLAVVTTRPEFAPPWAGRHNVSTLALQRLDRAHAREMVETITGGVALPAEVMDQIVAKTDGVPLFVEELTKTVIESGFLVKDGGSFRATGPLPTFAIPATLQDSLMARLDRLNVVKEIAQIGAAIGREFSYRLLVAVAGMDEVAVREALARLEEAELATRRGVLPDATYTFKHALVQDAAYESLLKSRRLTIHRRIAKALRDKFPGLAETEPEIVAHHFTQAQKAEQAIEWWTKSGNVAAGRASFIEAIGHFERAIALSDRQPLDPRRLQSRLALYISYREPLIAVCGWADQKTIEAFRRSSELGSLVDDPEQRLANALADHLSTFISGQARQSLPIAESYLAKAKEIGDDTEIMTGTRFVGQSLFFCGDYIRAREFLSTALSIYKQETHAHLAKQHGGDTKSTILGFLSVVLGPMGRVEEARLAVGKATTHARQVEDVSSLAMALGFACCLEAISDDWPRLSKAAQILIDLSQVNDLILWRTVGQFYRLAAEGFIASDSAALSRAKDLFSLLEQMNFGCIKPQTGALIADLQNITSFESAISILDGLLYETSISGNSWFDAELQRRRGRILTQGHRLDDAQNAFTKAVATARQQNARTFELRASLDLARLYCDTGRQAEASALLAPALVGFTETSELPELADAHRLLATLSE